MLYTSPLFSRARGSLAGLTTQMTHAGQILRRRARTHHKRTDATQRAQQAMQRSSLVWHEIYTQAQRDRWEQAAKTRTQQLQIKTDKITTGYQLYLRLSLFWLNQFPGSFINPNPSQMTVTLKSVRWRWRVTAAGGQVGVEWSDPVISTGASEWSI